MWWNKNIEFFYLHLVFCDSIDYKLNCWQLLFYRIEFCKIEKGNFFYLWFGNRFKVNFLRFIFRDRIKIRPHYFVLFLSKSLNQTWIMVNGLFTYCQCDKIATTKINGKKKYSHDIQLFSTWYIFSYSITIKCNSS